MLPSESLRKPTVIESAVIGAVQPAHNPLTRLIGRYGLVSTHSRNIAVSLSSWTFACFNERAKGVAGLIKTAKRDNPLTSQDDLEDLPSGHWVSQRLKRPNRYMKSARTFFSLATWYLDTAGDVFIWTPTYGDSVPREMILLTSSNVQFVPGDNDSEPLVKAYRFNTGGGIITVPESEICHIRHAWPWPDMFRMMFKGRSLLDAIEDVISVDRETLRYLRAFFENGAKPEFAFQLPAGQSMGPEQFADFINRYDETHRGVDNAGGYTVLENGMTIATIASSGREREMSDLDKANRTRICASTGVPEGILTMLHQNKATADTTESSFFRRTIAELGALILGELGAHFSRYEYGIEIVTNDYMTNDPEDQRADELHLASLGMPVNEIFKKRGLPMVAGGDISRYTIAIKADAPALPAAAPEPPSDAPALSAPAAPTVTPAPQPTQSYRTPERLTAATEGLSPDAERMAAIYWKRMDDQAIGNAAVLMRDIRKIITWMQAETIGTDTATVTASASSGLSIYRYATFDLATAQTKAETHVGPDIGRILDEQLRQAIEEAGMTWEESAPLLANAHAEMYDTIMANISGSIAKIHDEIGDIGLAMKDKPAADVHAALTEKFAVFAGPRAETIAQAAAKLAESRSKRMAWMAISPRADGLSFRGRWIDTGKLTVRETHQAANGQLMGPDWTFVVGGVKMNGPGDVADGGNAKEIFRCQCTMQGVWVV